MFDEVQMDVPHRRARATRKNSREVHNVALRCRWRTNAQELRELGPSHVIWLRAVVVAVSTQSRPGEVQRRGACSLYRAVSLVAIAQEKLALAEHRDEIRTLHAVFASRRLISAYPAVHPYPPLRPKRGWPIGRDRRDSRLGKTRRESPARILRRRDGRRADPSANARSVNHQWTDGRALRWKRSSAAGMRVLAECTSAKRLSALQRLWSPALSGEATAEGHTADSWRLSPTHPECGAPRRHIRIRALSLDAA